jgi:hypothetical protein
MKKKELERLLGFVDQNEDETYDFSGFRDSQSAKGTFKDLLLFRESGKHAESDFSSHFADKVMQKVIHLSKKQGIEEYLSMQLYKVVSFGLSAAAIFFLALYLFQAQDGIGPILGTDRSNDINFISYVFYEF